MSNISTCLDLQNMKQSLSGKYQLTEDINCNGTLFHPIGSYSLPFTGTLEGNRFKINNLTINRNSNFIGIFSYTKGAIISNIIFQDFFINTCSTCQNVALVAGQSNDTMFFNITLTSSGKINKVSGNCKSTFF